MSKLTDELRLELPVEKSSLVCRSAIATIGWNIKSLDQHRIVPKVGVGLTKNPSNIEVLLAPSDGSQTIVTINGSIMGVGPIQKNHLRGEMNRLRNAIEVAATSIPGSDAPQQTTGDADHMAQLHKLGALRDAGVLTSDEFEAKKREILERI